MKGSIESRVPWDTYADIEGDSITRLKSMMRSPQHYLYRLEHGKESPALSLGKAAHTATLEPERFARQYAIWNRRSEKTGNLCPRNGQYYDAFLAENDGKEIITEDESTLAITIHGAVRSNAVAGKYLETGDPEVTMQWSVDGRRRKGRVDWLTNDEEGPVLVGLKTARDCRPIQFGNAAARLGYPLQWAWYLDGYVAIRGVEPRVIEIVVESEPPHAVSVFNITPDIIAQGRDEYERLLGQLIECEATGHFPGPCEGEEDLTLPSWYFEQYDDLSDIGLAVGDNA